MGDKNGILVLGISCLDVVVSVNKFPVEDTLDRASGVHWQTGGNGNNTCTVFSLLGEKIELFCTFGGSHEISFILADLARHGISIEHCPRYPEKNCPTSMVIVNEETGTRTIMHYNRNLPELTVEDLQSRINLRNYKWVHFEGRRRNHIEISKMLEYTRDFNRTQSTENRVTTSVELENPGIVDLEPLAKLADYVFISKDYAKDKGFHNMTDAVEGFIDKCSPNSTLICAWGEDGASAKPWGEPSVTSTAFPPVKLIDTLGAGDTFNAATIQALSKGSDLKSAITYGCQVAGAKCGILGYAGLKDMDFATKLL